MANPAKQNLGRTCGNCAKKRKCVISGCSPHIPCGHWAKDTSSSTSHANPTPAPALPGVVGYANTSAAKIGLTMLRPGDGVMRSTAGTGTYLISPTPKPARECPIYNWHEWFTPEALAQAKAKP